MVNYERKPLDSALYSMEPKVARLYKASTGIHDDEELKRHILRVQAEAYRAFSYPCIRLFSFTRLAVPDVPLYNDILRLGAKRSGAILLEIGTGFGNDLRKVIADGYPVQDAVAVDLTPQLWEIGHRLFRSNSTTFPVKFIQGDIFDEAILSSNAPPAWSRPYVRHLKTLTPLKGQTSVIMIQSVFHLFDASRQHLLARRLAQLLSSARGSLIVGRQMGHATPKRVVDGFVHNRESWEAMWSTIFPRGTVEYYTELRDLPEDLMGATVDMLGVSQFLTWSIRRL